MSDKEKKEVTFDTKSEKELTYDDKSGRFFETGDSVECIPEDEYCAVDKDTGEMIRLTVEEKERIFLDALQSYYVSGRQMLNDEEFDLLKEDLAWNGSDVAVLNRQEARFLAATQAYMKGEPMMSDVEFDALKSELREEGSRFAVDTEPKCYVDTGICKVTMQEDKFRNNLLYLPAGAILTVGWLALGFEIIEPLIRLNPLVLLLLGAYPIYQGSLIITNDFLFPNNKIVYGPCPSCEVNQRVYFGNILGVEGFNDVATSKCTNCKVQFQVQKKSMRASTVLPKN
uniref:Uncharacterized protein n=2 Tax=Minutocellus polymorphus TaxID=265543 RepID=A0A7S0AKF5_9STRA